MNKFTVIILISLLAVGGFLVYKRNQNEEARLRAEIYLEQAKIEVDQEKERERKLGLCLSSAEKEYSEHWNSSCEYEGTRIEKDGNGKITGCWLPGRFTDLFDKQEKETKDNCFRRYQ